MHNRYPSWGKQTVILLTQKSPPLLSSPVSLVSLHFALLLLPAHDVFSCCFALGTSHHAVQFHEVGGGWVQSEVITENVLKSDYLELPWME